MKVAILDYTRGCVDIIDVLLPKYSTEEIESELERLGYKLSQIAWMSGEDIPVTHKTSIDKLLENCKRLEAEIKETDRCKEFLINEYKTNKRWFRLEPGKVTIEDVIRASFEFGWSCKRNFDHDTRR